MAAGRQQGGVRIIPFISFLGWSSATPYCSLFFSCYLWDDDTAHWARHCWRCNEGGGGKHPFFRNRIDIVEGGQDRKDVRKKKDKKKTSQGQKFDSEIQECRRRSFKLRA
ncbi:hypothetical protein V8C34DRAFT_240041 [Trichoderma compactum]